MSLNDSLANVLSHILIEDKKGKVKIVLSDNSKLIKSVLNLLKDNKYVGELKETKDDKGGMLEINLIGAVNKIGVIKPRTQVKATNYKKYEKRFLPASGFGLLIVSTNKGIMTQEDAIKQNLGGKLLAYVY
jgi:small subunit ribosomal protein S8